MGSPQRVIFIKQLDGSRYQGDNCTCAATAMAIYRHTLGKTKTSGSYVRYLTKDTSGGTNLGQNVYAASKLGVALEVEYSYPLASFDARLRAGRGAVLQGQSSATRGTKYQASETFGGNHAWYVNEARGWDSNGRPKEYLVYDPLADGRRPGIAKSPFWLPRAYLLRFAERLWLGSRRLGPGKVYAAFTKDTEPHTHWAYGGVRTAPYPDRTRAIRTPVNVRTSPFIRDNIVKNDELEKGDLFVAWQKTGSGQSYKGSRTWYGNHNGDRWVHSSRLRYKGGST